MVLQNSMFVLQMNIVHTCTLYNDEYCIRTLTAYHESSESHTFDSFIIIRGFFLCVHYYTYLYLSPGIPHGSSYSKEFGHDTPGSGSHFRQILGFR